jgi:MFS family permease
MSESEHHTDFRSEAPQAPSPEKRAGAGLIAVYVLAYLGIWIAAFAPIIVSLPLRVRQIDPQNYIADLSGILAVGALLAMFANPFFGRLSDRTTSRFGMRRPWLVLGAGSGLVGVLIIAQVQSILAIAVGWCLTQLAINILLAVTTAILPDQVGAEQRGKVSGYLAMCIAIAPTAGALLVKYFIASPLMMFFVPALIMACGSLLLALVLKDRRMAPSEVPPYGLGEFLRSFWIDWFRYGDFSWLWLSRFLRFLSLSTLISYEVYFINDRLGQGVASTSGIIVVATLINALTGVIGANGAGFLSDMIKRRKLIMVVGSVLYSIGLVALAYSSTVSFFYLAIAITGVAHGMWVAMDFALVAEVLPDARTEAAKNLGVFNVASALPQSVAPAIASVILTGGSGSYTTLFLMAAAAAFAGAMLVPLIRHAR